MTVPGEAGRGRFVEPHRPQANKETESNPILYEPTSLILLGVRFRAVEGLSGALHPRTGQKIVTVAALGTQRGNAANSVSHAASLLAEIDTRGKRRSIVLALAVTLSAHPRPAVRQPSSANARRISAPKVREAIPDYLAFALRCVHCECEKRRSRVR